MFWPTDFIQIRLLGIKIHRRAGTQVDFTRAWNNAAREAFKTNRPDSYYTDGMLYACATSNGVRD